MAIQLGSSALINVAVILIVGSCATRARQADLPGTIPATAGAQPTCPLGLVGTKVAIADVNGGVDLSFTTSGDVNELRRRVRNQALEHGPGAHAGLGHGGTHMGAHTHGLRLWQIAPVTATATDLDDGARLHVVAKDPAASERVRVALHERAAYIVALGECR
jgi:hypothetical protein